jgi:hypothetical protein
LKLLAVPVETKAVTIKAAAGAEPPAANDTAAAVRAAGQGFSGPHLTSIEYLRA